MKILKSNENFDLIFKIFRDEFYPDLADNLGVNVTCYLFTTTF